MKKSPPFVLFLLLCCVATSRAQTGGYRYDNFDMQQGVRIATAPTPVALPGRNLRPTAMMRGGGGKLAHGIAQPKPALYTATTTAAARPMLSMTPSKSLDGFTTGDNRVDALIVESAARNGVDPVLLYAIMHRESSFKSHAVSPKGARGLMQLMPGTAARFGVRNIFDPAQNVEGGARYVRFLLNYFDGDVSLALAGYNAGEGAVDRYGRRVPPFRETQEYVRLIGQRYALMRDPQVARTAQKFTSAQAAAIAAESTSANLYERSVYAVRLPDGKLRLVSQ